MSLFLRAYCIKGGFGQCLMVGRDSYFQIGGHAVIKEKIVENLALVQLASTKDYPVYAISGKGIINMRMYRNGIKSVFQGWSKSFATGSTMTNPCC